MAKDSEALNLGLHTLSGRIPQCVLQSLTLNAIAYTWYDGVDLLLRNGASADLVLWSKTESSSISEPPVTACLGKYEDIVWEAVRNKHWPRNLVENILKLDEMLSILIIASRKGELLLHGIDAVAVLNPKMAEFLIEKGRPCLNVEANGRAPLVHPLHELLTVLTDEPSEFAAKVCAKIFADGILPLIRAGVKSWKLLDYMYSAQIPLICTSINSPGDSYSCRIWGRDDAMFDILIEAAGHSSLDVAKMRGMVEEAKREAPTRAADATAFAELASKRFPRPLIAITRQVILRHLPVGLVNCRNAVENLDISKPLINYLSFKEFNVLPNLLSKN